MKKSFIIIILLLSMVSLGAQTPTEIRDTLQAARITSEAATRDAITQTSLMRLDSRKLNRGFAFLGSSDLIKTLQQLPGVASGTELMSGLYVRGGDGYDNLFLLDGVPMYQVTHLIGLFSSFNTDVIDNLDFYKGGFPARYGGRMSSVIDVSTKEGDFNEYHGKWSLGLIDGRFQMEGPLIKGKTSFNVAMRRTWFDTVTIPAFAYINHKASKDPDETERIDGHYDMTDFNAKIVHKFSPQSKLTANFYTGDDLLRFKVSYTDSKDLLKGSMKWGNTLASLKWNWSPDKLTSLDVTGYFTRYKSDITSDVITDNTPYDGLEDWNRSGLDVVYANVSGQVRDFGVTSHLDRKLSDRQHLRAGLNASTHHYRPSYSDKFTEVYNDSEVVLLDENERETKRGWEVNAFAEDEVIFGDNFTLNAGLRASLYGAPGKVWPILEPRAAASYRLSPILTTKLSYSRMSQYSHQVSSVYIELPTSFWMPSTAVVKPMISDQVAGGVYFSFPFNLKLNIEAYYKSLEHLYEFNGAGALLPPIHKWEEAFLEGRGRSYGAEFECEYQTERLQAAVYYTLAKTERYFSDFYYTWYPDRNDNRHKLTLTASWRINDKFELYGAWNYHSGSRMTLMASSLIFPVETIPDEDGYYDLIVTDLPELDMRLYSGPNNIQLPDYHRLDLGLNWHRTTRHGNHATWTLSLYNTYCRLNAVYAETDRNPYTGESYAKAYGIIPIVPTLSYSLSF